MTLYLQDLTEGATFDSRARTITEADIVSFAGLSGDYNPLHTDETWVAEHTEFRGRIAHGLLVLAVSSGLGTPGIDDLEVLAYLEVTRKMVAAVYPGDTLRVTYTVEGVRASRSRPDTGVVTLAVAVRSQEDEVVQTGSDVLLVGTDPNRPGPGAAT